MKLTRIFSLFKLKGVYVKPVFNSVKSVYLRNNHCVKSPIIARNFSGSAASNIKITHDGSDSDSEIESDVGVFDGFYSEMDQGYARDLLYKSSKDLLLNRIYNCVSVQELFNVFDQNKDSYRSWHLVQNVLVLWDLKTIFYGINSFNDKNVEELAKDFVAKLNESASFQQLLRLIEERNSYFNANELSYILLYLNKLGLSIETPLLQLLAHNLHEKMLENFSISPASRYLETVFSDFNLRSYSMSQSLVPYVFQQIETCEWDTFEDVTTSLNKLHNLVSGEILHKYKKKVMTFFDKGEITAKDYKVILKIVSFLNYPKWRDKHVPLTARCILLIKGNLNSLNISELVILYDVFFKIQEPGAVLNELQRCSSKYLQQFEGTSLQKIRLFSSLVYFSSPHLRAQYQKAIKKYIKECNSFENLLQLRRILSYVKVSDVELCQFYWDKVLRLIKPNNGDVDLIKLAHNYRNFNTDIDNFRHLKFQHEILRLLENLARNTVCEVLPQKIVSILTFALIYSDDHQFLEFLVGKIDANWQQLNHIDCLKLATTLRLLRDSDEKYLKHRFSQIINKVVNKVIAKEAENDENLWKNHALLKACIFQNNVSDRIVRKLLLNYRGFYDISSKSIESMTYSFMQTNALIPEVLESFADYVILHHENLLGFNLEKLLYLFYWLGYHPKKLDQFCETASNVIIRDQERMGGLSLLHCALSLCFFNRLPNSFVKSIFNVEFLDKLDVELANCYSKEKYPQKVRHNLMQLNRAVCLDYPESNVPWFHQKYLDDSTENGKIEKMFPRRVKECLIKILQNGAAIKTNVITPYGYHIDFVINLNSEEEAVIHDTKTKLALLLMPQYAFTRIVVHLRGRYQLKKRHLEMLGYRVVMVNFNDWLSMFHPQERIQYLSNLIWPKKYIGLRETR